MYRSDIQLVAILSLPRSGSTVLTAELDRHKGVVSVPETYFTGVIECASVLGRRLDSCLPALFAECCDAGMILSREELAACMNPDDWRQTLIDIGLQVARNAGRTTDHVTTVVYKTTRLVSFTKVLRMSGAKFIVLRRDPVNVFESQFRVSFGVYNRDPWRFALFRESYEAVFTTLPTAAVLAVDYRHIPVLLPDILAWIGGSNSLWQDGESSHAMTARQPWHAGLLDGFRDSDIVKQQSLSAGRKQKLEAAMRRVTILRPLLRHARRWYDRKLAMRLLDRAGCSDS